MTYDSLLIHTVTITTPTSTVASTDRYGNSVLSTVVNVYAARVQAVLPGGEERITMRDTRVQEFLVFLPKDAVVDALSTIDWGGRTLRVAGEPAHRDALTAAHHIELTAEEVLG